MSFKFDTLTWEKIRTILAWFDADTGDATIAGDVSVGGAIGVALNAVTPVINPTGYTGSVITIGGDNTNGNNQGINLVGDHGDDASMGNLNWLNYRSASSTKIIGQIQTRWSGVANAGKILFKVNNGTADNLITALTLDYDASATFTGIIKTDDTTEATTTTDGSLQTDGGLSVAKKGVFGDTVKVGAYTLPATDGTAGQVLVTNGSGVLTWTTL